MCKAEGVSPPIAPKRPLFPSIPPHTHTLLIIHFDPFNPSNFFLITTLTHQQNFTLSPNKRKRKKKLPHSSSSSFFFKNPSQSEKTTPKTKNSHSLGPMNEVPFHWEGKPQNPKQKRKKTIIYSLLSLSI